MSTPSLNEKIAAILPSTPLPRELESYWLSILSNKKLWRPQKAQAAETIAVTFTKQKTALLCYDRVWDPSGYIPDDLRFSGVGKAEIILYWLGILSFHRPSYANVDDDGYIMAQKIPSLSVIAQQANPDELRRYLVGMFIEDHQKSPLMFGWMRRFCYELSADYSLRSVPVYDSSAHWQKEFLPEQVSVASEPRNVLLTTLCDLAVVDEEGLSWDQIREFRADKLNRERYLSCLHWFSTDLLGKSQEFIQNEIAVRLENYKHALRKHGLETVKGTLEWVISGSTLAKASSAIGASVFLSQTPLWGLLAGSGYVVGECVVKLLENKIKLEDIEYEHRDIAYIHSLQNRLKP